VSDWASIFLGVIALATLTTAIAQVGVLVAASRLARRIEGLIAHVDQEAKPIFGHLNAIGRDASRAASLATAQVERVDRLVTTIAERLEDILHTLQTAVAKPARDGAAVVAGFKAAMSVFREVRGGRARARAEDEEALFI
jgi:hypothetical protein